MKPKDIIRRLQKIDRSKLSEAERKALEEALKAETIPKGTYRVRRISAGISRKGFDYIITQKFRITEGEYAGREILTTQELDDSDILELREDAEV